MTVVNDFLIKNIDEIINKHHYTSICDYGCGEGNLLRDISDKHGADLKFTGIDHFTLFPEDKRPESKNNFTFIDKDGDEFTNLFSENVLFDLIISTFAYHHFQYPVQELRNIETLLKRDGLFYLVDFGFTNNTDAQIVKNIVSCLGDMFSALQLKYHRHHYTLDEAKDLISSSNLTIVEAGTVNLDLPEDELNKSAEEFLEYLEEKHNNLSYINNPILQNLFNMNIEYVIGLLKKYKIEFSSLIVIKAKK